MRPLLLIDHGLIHADEAQALKERQSQVMGQSPAIDALARKLAGCTRHVIEGDRLPDEAVQPALLHFLNQELRLAHPDWLDGLPWAALSALADGLSPWPGEGWATLYLGELLISPTQVGFALQATQERSQQLSPPRLRALREGLQEGLGDPEACALQGRSGGLYLRTSRPLQLSCAHPRLIEGLHLPSFEPQGPDAARWRRASHIVQMLWHQENNAAHAAPQILWAWGAGAGLPAACLKTLKETPHGMKDMEDAPLWLIGLIKALTALGLPPDIHYRTFLPSGDSDPAREWWQDWAKWARELEEIAARSPRGAWKLVVTQGSQGLVFESAPRSTMRGALAAMGERIRIGSSAPLTDILTLHDD
ncbi:MAG: hypothetical protein EBS90_06480 [Betaproteobacteria bacterium]|nr:hypothetical protein [Betaproteobacteria bacterium]